VPFDEQGDLLLEKLSSNIRKLNQSRLRGYLVLGTNGEFRSLSSHEQIEVLKTVVKTASSGKVIMAGTGAESTKVSIELCHEAAEIGAHYGSLITPFFFAKKMTDKAFALLKERVKEEAFLEQELNKLLDYAGDKDTIELKDVAAVITETHEETLITLFEAMAQKSHRELIAILENLLSNGLHILAIHSYLIRQIRLLLQAKDIEELYPTEMDYKMFTKTLGTLKEGLDSPPRERKHFLAYQKPYYAFKLSKTSAKSSGKDLLNLYSMLVELEKSIKTGTKHDRTRLETALLEV
jgi:hypothetical protein